MESSDKSRTPAFEVEVEGASARQREDIIARLAEAYMQQLRFFERMPGRFQVTVCADEASWEAQVGRDHSHALSINRGAHLILRSDESDEMIRRFPELAVTSIGAFTGHELSHSCWRLLPNGPSWTPYWLCEGVASVYNPLAHYPTIEVAVDLWRKRYATDKRLLAFDYRVGILEDVGLRSAAYRIWGHIVQDLVAVTNVTPRELVSELSSAGSMEEAEQRLARHSGQTMQHQVEVMLDANAQ